MKSSPLLLILATTFAGCASKAAPAARTQPTEANPATAYATYETQNYVTPGQYRVYHCGPVYDPAHPDLITTGGDVVIREKAERWRLSSSPARERGPQFQYGPKESNVSPAFHPDPVAAEYDQQLARASRLVKALAARTATLEKANIALRADLAVPKTVDTANGANSTLVDANSGGSSNSVMVTGTNDKDLITLFPNSEGIIEMDLALIEQPGIGELNPFALRFASKPQTRTVPLQITSLAIGPHASVTLNKKLIGIGDTYDGFKLHTIDANGIFLRREGFLIRIPVTEKPIQVRVP